MTTSYLTFMCVEFELTAVLLAGDAVRRDDRDGCVFHDFRSIQPVNKKSTSPIHADYSQ